ncbi:hypothetical protein ARSEF4850_008826 [Beauveria asiatica]
MACVNIDELVERMAALSLQSNNITTDCVTVALDNVHSGSPDSNEDIEMLGSDEVIRVAADKAAKDAARKHGDPSEPNSLRTLMGPTKTIIHKTMRAEWAASWEMAKHGRELFRLRVKLGKTALDLCRGTYRAVSSVMTQVRKGKIGLGAYLHAINKADTDKC